GRPLPGTKIYIVDRRLRPVPVGIPGEALIGGPGVALGYLSSPEAASVRFITDPFAERLEARCYRTGDRMRWRADGNLEFRGRLDEQIKVRGFRVEPSEIEAVLREIPGVKDAAVIADAPRGQTRLVAYVAAETDVHPDELRAFVAERLPDAMVPAVVVAVPK